MTAKAIQTYTAMPERVATSADIEVSRRVDVEVQPACAIISSGQPAGENSAQSSLWVPLSGFGLAAALAPCYRYSPYDVARLLEAQRLHALQAESGAASVRPREQLDAAPVAPGWLWLINRMKTILEAAARIVGVAQQARPAEDAVNDLKTHVAQDGDSLSLCAKTFYDGDQARYRKRYNMVFRSENEQAHDYSREQNH